MSQTKTQTNPTTVEQDDRPVYEFFFPKECETHDRVELSIKMRKWLDQMPETKATFRFFAKSGPFSHGERTTIQSIPLWFFGIWRVVPPFKSAPSANNPHRFVNPNYIHAKKYPDCIVQCECGAYVAHTRRTTGGQLGPASEHKEDCRLEWRYECRAGVVRERRSAVRQGLLFGLEQKTIMSRLGMKRNSFGGTVQKLNIDVKSLREKRKKLLTFTADELLQQGYSKTEVCDAFGITYRKLRLRLKEFDLYYGRHD